MEIHLNEYFSRYSFKIRNGVEGGGFVVLGDGAEEGGGVVVVGVEGHFLGEVVLLLKCHG